MGHPQFFEDLLDPAVGGEGGPFKPSFGLSGAVRQPDRKYGDGTFTNFAG